MSHTSHLQERSPTSIGLLFLQSCLNICLWSLKSESVFESRWLACSAHTVGDDACRARNAAEMFQTVEMESFRSQQCRRRSRLHSKRCLGVVRLFLQPGDVLIFRWNSSLAVLRQTVLRHPTVLYWYMRAICALSSTYSQTDMVDSFSDNETLTLTTLITLSNPIFQDL